MLLYHDLIMPLLSRPLIYPYKISFNNAPIPYTIPHTHTANNKFTSIIFYLSNQPLYLFQILIGDTVQSSYKMLHYQLAIGWKTTIYYYAPALNMPLIMIDYHLAIPLMVNQKPVTFQDTSHDLYRLYNILFGEKTLIKYWSKRA